MMQRGYLKRIRLVNDTILDFSKMTAGKGVFHLTLQNNGDTTVVLDDATREEIQPMETFVVESPIAIINHNFSILFKQEEGKKNSLIVSYITTLDECKQ